MTALELGAVVVQALGWCLVHFIWQATLIGGLYALVRLMLPRGNARYLAAMLALIALAAVPTWTAVHEVRSLAQPGDLGNMLVTAGVVSSGAPTATGGANGWLALLGAGLPWLVLAWGCGVAVLGMRVTRQWHALRAIVSAAEALPVWQARAQRLGEHLGLRRAVRVLASVRIATPTLVGWARPVVVMPLAMLARMPVAQVDLILAHELAHLRRFDHIANLFQVVLETLLFYHPVVHWISRDARNERELCCDALALQASGGNRRDFVAALAGLEEFRADHAGLALAASGGVLVERAWFIAGVKPHRRRVRPGVIAVALPALLGVAVMLAMVWRQDMMQERVEDVLAANAAVLQHDIAAVGRPLPAPTWQRGDPQRPQLAPVVMPSAMPFTAAATALRVAPSAINPAVSIPDLGQIPLQVRPAILPSDVAASAAPTPVAAAPRAIHTVQPVYPEQALLSGAQGQVEIQFTLTGSGVPENLQVARSSESGQFGAAAMQALSRWRFTPPATAGRVYLQTFTFRLDAAAAGDDAAAARACLVRTGTHICRPVVDAPSGVGTVRLNR